MSEDPRVDRPQQAFSPSAKPLPISALRWRCSEDDLPFKTTADVEPMVGVAGQDSAVEALRFGLETRAPGQNIFVRGLTGTGRMTLIRRLMEELRLACPETRDRCYVHNFSQPDRPRLITLRRGQGKFFKRRMDELADFIREHLSKALASDALRARQVAMERESQAEIQAIAGPLEQTLREAGLAIVSVNTGPMVQTALFPMHDGKAVPPEEWRQLRSSGQVGEEDEARFRKAHDSFQQRLQEATEQIGDIRRRHLEAVGRLAEDAARAALAVFCGDIIRNYPDPNVRLFLDELVDDVVAYHLRGGEESDYTRLYRVNLVLSQGEAAGCPIVVAGTPTMANLLGSIDHVLLPDGRRQADHIMIRAGALLQADGGFLIVDARDVLREPGAWKVLIRTLRTGLLEAAPAELNFPFWGPSLKPEPVDVNIKVVLLGDAEMYYMLDNLDPDFPDLFKVLADFDTVLDRDAKGISQYAAILSRLATEEQLPPMERGAVAALVEHGSRIAASGGKLTARFGRLADLAREAGFLVTKDGRRTVTAADVKAAVRRSKARADLPSRRFQELLANGTIHVQTQGRVVGQINGLAVIQAGQLTYGFPARITAAIGPGHTGVVDINREAALSGAIHTKGFYILGGLLRRLLRTAHPLAFHASLVFEQSYGEIDGDSASGAEMCCLLSALTDVPLRQDMAMTGAIDQMGHLMAIGGANEKIEGFFDTCRDLGLTGTQGVIIPRSNAGDLMLREDVVEACAAGKFAVYAVEYLQEALELLTDMPAGTEGDDGQYADSSLLGIAVARAFQYWVMASQTFDPSALAEPGEQLVDEGPVSDDEVGPPPPADPIRR